MPRHAPAVLGVLLASLAFLHEAAPAAELKVRKIAESFDESRWPPEGWNKAAGTTALSPAAARAGSGKCLNIEVRFSGKGFEWFGAVPGEPLVVPGRLKSVALQYKQSDKRYGLAVKFKDGWGRSEAGSKKLEWGLPADAEGQWKTARFEVPADWVQPVTIAGLATHNWSQESQARSVHFWVDDLEVETDLAEVDPNTGALATWKADPQPKDPKKAAAQSPRAPLKSMTVATSVAGNVFSQEEPAAVVHLRNWSPGSLRGTLVAEIRDRAGRSCGHIEQSLTVESGLGLPMPLKVDRFGVYTLEATFAVSDGSKLTARMPFARLAPVKELSPDQKRSSPYGINVNGGRENFNIEPFRKAGIVWFRDYAFSFDWLERAKGDDRQYAGWPWFPSLVRRYRESGAMVLPCLMRSIRPPKSAAGPLGPDRAWTRAVADIVLAFPEMTHWELDNEYDLSKEHFDAETAVNWRNYGAYHRRLGEIVELLGGGEATAVEQGTAGIVPDRVRSAVLSGDFAKIGVVNSHHYCGTEAPEVNIGNWNTDSGADFRRQPPMLYFDRLRAVKQAACCDGRTRQSWLTEFGWDTLAGPKVSDEQQAAYLARGWLLALAAGTDKCFWFYDYDAAEPKQFFDGCGLLAADGTAKLSLCAMAGLASVLPNPKYVGSLDAGPGTCGYVFSNGDELVAALWSVNDDSGPTVSFQAKELRDYLGNRLPGMSVRLSSAPVYAVGLDRNDRWFQQTAYELKSPHLIGATAGDTAPVVLEVRNHRATPIEAQVRPASPQGWTVEANAEAKCIVPPGETKSVSLSLDIPATEPMGSKEVMLTVVEKETVKQIPIRVLIQPGVTIEAAPLRGSPGSTTLAVRLGNRSTRPVDGVLRLQLPKTWKAAVSETAIPGLKPDEVRQVDCGLAWSTQWAPDERAVAIFDLGGGRAVSANIAPAQLRLHRAGQIKIDGRGDEWPAEARLPDWVLGSSVPKGTAVSLAWAPDGIYGLVEVADAELENPDPRSFWACNCLELFLDGRNDKRDRTFTTGDHQFWFVPLVTEGRVYAGQWKRGDETPETRYDLKAVRGVAATSGRGYTMEFRLPASEFKSLPLEGGRKIGLNLNLTIKTKDASREVFWPSSKASGAPGKPSLWGTVELQ